MHAQLHVCPLRLTGGVTAVGSDATAKSCGMLRAEPALVVALMLWLRRRNGRGFSSRDERDPDASLG